MENQPNFLPEDDDSHEEHTQSNPGKPKNDKSLLIHILIAIILIFIIGKAFG